MDKVLDYLKKIEIESEKLSESAYLLAGKEPHTIRARWRELHSMAENLAALTANGDFAIEQFYENGGNDNVGA